MDEVLIRYLNSGKAWLLVGSGPSSEMGYPSWHKLAELAIEALQVDRPGIDPGAVKAALNRRKYPEVFEKVEAVLGSPRLRQVLQENMTPTRPGKIYEMLARWPVPVYLTTNFDDEIQRHLTSLGEPYIAYPNSADHFSRLLPDLDGVIVKLHGDLTSDTGLILTANRYRDIVSAISWQYWRTRMTSIFQMNRVIVIGHSLTDTNIRHVLTAAQGTGVAQPVCWIAPDVSIEERRNYLEKFRIRVISYDNSEGDHRNLLRLIQHINEFVFSRTAVGIQEQIAKVARSPLGDSASAPGFFVFNKLSVQSDYEEKRIEIMLAALQSALPALSSQQPFTLQTALELVGWPQSFKVSQVLAQSICDRAIQDGLFVRAGHEFRIGNGAEALARENNARFEHMRERFKTSLRLRARRSYDQLSLNQAEQIADDIEASLTGYFRDGGLTLTTILFAEGPEAKSSVKPSSIIKFVSESAARYDTLLMRQAFTTVSVDVFSHAEEAERDYLGRIVQGYFAFHALGVFGDAAIERLKQAKQTVWLIDSNAQIAALALAAPTNVAFADCFTRLRDAGVRLFTTEKLFDETFDHFWFAHTLIKKSGHASHDVIAAAKGQAPYYRSNEFLGGFIRWQAAGHPRDWSGYLFEVFEKRRPTKDDIKNRLQVLGVEVLAFQDWPGFSDDDYQEACEHRGKIVDILEGREIKAGASADNLKELWGEFNKKADPESEASVIVKREREGNYYIRSEPGVSSPAWFISDTSILNILDHATRVTWQTEVFLRFTSALSLSADPQDADRAFEALLWGCAQAGLNLIDDSTIEAVFGGIIDQTTLSLVEQNQIYQDTMTRYGESPEDILKRLPASQRPLAAVQLAQQAAQMAEQRQHDAEAASAFERRRAETAEKELAEVDKYRKRMRTEEEKAKFRTAKQRSKKKGKTKKKRKK